MAPLVSQMLDTRAEDVAAWAETVRRLPDRTPQVEPLQTRLEPAVRAVAGPLQQLVQVLLAVEFMPEI